MNGAGKRLWSYLAAGVLAVITLSVFYILRDFGPESTIREFHRAAEQICSYEPQSVPFRPAIVRLDQSLELVRIVSPPDLANEHLGFIIDSVRNEIYHGAQVDIVRVDYKSPSLAIVATQYSFPDGKLGFGVWIVQLDHGHWRIDIERTYATWGALK